MKNKKNLIIILIVILSIVSLYFFSNKTYTSYESKVDDDIEFNIADWKIKIDEQDIATATRDISLKNVTWENAHANNNTVAPGSKGTIKMKIDPTTTQVDIEYVLSFVDHTMDENCLLTVTSMYLEDGELNKISDNSYSGLITLDDIKKGKFKTLIINVEWINDEENNEIDSAVGANEIESSYLIMELNASQYKGE